MKEDDGVRGASGQIDTAERTSRGEGGLSSNGNGNGSENEKTIGMHSNNSNVEGAESDANRMLHVVNSAILSVRMIQIQIQYRSYRSDKSYGHCTA